MDLNQFTARQRAALEALSVRRTIAQAASEVGISKSIIHRWKKTNDQFAIAFKAARLEAERVQKEILDRGKPLGLVKDEKKNQFLELYAATGDKELAAKKAGLAYDTVVMALEPGSPEYDDDFYKEFHRAHTVVGRKIEDRFITNALKGADRDVASSQKWALERLFPERYSSKSKLEVEAKVDTRLTVDQQAVLFEGFWATVFEDREVKQIEQDSATDDSSESEEPQRLLAAGQSEGGSS